MEMIGLDVLKLFFAMCVVAIHTYLAEALPEPAPFWITQSLLRLAVPFFFTASGFLLGKKLHEQDQRPSEVIGCYIKKWLPLMLFVELINGLPELLVAYFQKGTEPLELLASFAHHLLCYPYGAMWFVQACSIGAILLYPFLKKKKWNLALCVGALLYGWALLCNNYYFLAHTFQLDQYVQFYMRAFLSGRNGVFVGFFYLALGIKTYEWHLKNKRIGILRGGLAGFAVLYLFEIFLLRERDFLDDRALYLTHAALAPLMVLCAARMRPFISQRRAVWMRKASIWIYFSHRFILRMEWILCSFVIGKELGETADFALVIFISMVSFVLVQRKRDACSASYF